jgi:hypothetical protein
LAALTRGFFLSRTRKPQPINRFSLVSEREFHHVIVLQRKMKTPVTPLELLPL